MLNVERDLVAGTSDTTEEDHSLLYYVDYDSVLYITVCFSISITVVAILIKLHLDGSGNSSVYYIGLRYCMNSGPYICMKVKTRMFFNAGIVLLNRIVFRHSFS